MIFVGIQAFTQLCKFGINTGDAVARVFQPSLLALQLAGNFRHTAMRLIQLALHVFALLLCGQQIIAQAAERGF